MKRFLPILLLAGLAACSSNGSNKVTPQQAVSIAQNAVMTLQSELAAVQPMLSAQQQTTAAVLAQDVGRANDVLKSLNSTMTANQTATALQQAEQDLNAVVAAVAVVPMPPPYSTAVAALAISLPIIEGFVNSQIPTASASLADNAARHAVIAAANDNDAKAMAASWK